jgi:hypothetical protein
MSAPDLRFSDQALSALGSAHTLIVPTDLPGAGCVDVARQAARAAADELDLEVGLYDRSAETWMDHPHPSGPHVADDLSEDFATLAGQLRELEASGVTARGWISTVPSLTEIATAVEAVGADAVLLPEPSCDRTLVDRLVGRTDPNAEVASTIERHTTHPVTVLSITDGTVDLAAAPVDADRR